MKLKDTLACGAPVLHGELSGPEIRGVTERLEQPDDPRTAWRVGYDAWREAYSAFLQIERARLLQAETPLPVILRQHRYLLFRLMARGEQLALALLADAILGDSERKMLVNQVDGFLDCMRDSWHTWHGESVPAHREMLAKFLD